MVTEAVHKSMQANKRADTKPELLVRKRLREAGLTGYRLQWKVPGRPDVAWPGKKVALFVNGCFWHRCPTCKLPLPKSNVEYWVIKFDRNVERDEKNLRELEAAGWKTHVIWECQLKKKAIDDTFAELLPMLAEELGKELRAPASAGPGADVPASADGGVDVPASASASTGGANSPSTDATASGETAPGETAPADAAPAPPTPDQEKRG